MLLRYNTATEIDFFMPDNSDPWSGKTGLSTITITYKKQGQSSFTTLSSPTITELGNGWYKLSVPTAMVDTYGFLVVRFSATGAKTQQQVYQVVGFNPYDSAGLGLSRIDATISSRSTLDQAGVQTALTNQGYTATRAGYLDRLDTTISSRMPAGNVTIGGYASGQDPATLVWGASSRTLTQLGNSLVDEIWHRVRSTSNPPSGSFGYYLDARVSESGGGGGGDGTDWTTTEKEQIRYVLGIDGDKSAPAGSTGWIPDIRSKTQQLQFTGGNVHSVIASYFSGMSPAEQVLMNTANKILANSSGHVTVAVNNDKTGYTLSPASVSQVADAVWSAGTRTLTSFGSLVSDVASAVWSYAIEASQSALSWMRLMGAVLFGRRVVSGGSESYRDWNDTKNRVVGSVDSSGNRSITTRDGS